MPTFASRPSFRPLALISALLVGLSAAIGSGCITTIDGDGPAANATEPLAPFDGVGVLSTREDDPIDIFVAAIEDGTTERAVPVEEVRLNLYQGLVSKLYSPLALDYADAALAELDAAQPDEATLRIGPQDADAVLMVRVSGWDTRLLETKGLIDAEADLRLIDQRDGALEQRLGWHVTRRFKLDSGLLKEATPQELQQYGARALALELLDLIPLRDPYPTGGASE